jgi:hypothetical protein
MLGQRLGQELRGEQVHVHDLHLGLPARVQREGALRHAAVVHEDVHVPAHDPERLPHLVRQRAQVAEVQHQDLGLLAANLPLHLQQLGLPSRGQQHDGAQLGELQRQLLADPGRRTGDPHALAFERRLQGFRGTQQRGRGQQCEVAVRQADERQQQRAEQQQLLHHWRGRFEV